VTVRLRDPGVGGSGDGGNKEEEEERGEEAEEFIMVSQLSTLLTFVNWYIKTGL
jgi:hypothetical protein